MATKVTEFKGYKILEISEEGDFYPLRIGVKKAKRIMSYISEIEQFVRENSK